MPPITRIAPITPIPFADGSPSPDTEIIDLRKTRKIQTDTNGYLKIHRRSQTIDWYREMPDILAFASNPILFDEPATPNS